MSKIGIITINYNNLKGLKETFKSLEEQTYKEFEYVVIDGNSSDGSSEFILENEEIIDNYLIEDDRGIYDALNKGVNLCEAEYILALNSGDTLVDENVLERVVSKIEEINSPVGVIFGKAIYTLDDEELGWTWPSIKGKFNVSNWLEQYNPNHQAAFIHKELYNKFQYNTHYKIFGDGDFWCRLKKEDVKFYYIDIELAYFELGGVSNASTNISTVFRTAQESSILNYFYSSGNIVKSFIKKYSRFLFKYFLRKFLKKERYYNFLKEKNIKDQFKYKI